MSAVIQEPMEALIEKHGDKVKHSLNSKELVESANTGEKQDTRWKKGQSGNPNGRTPGAKNKLNELFYKDVYHDWEAHGNQAIATLREADNTKYCQLVAAVLPKTLELDTKDGVNWVICANPKTLTTDQWMDTHGLIEHDSDDDSSA